MKWSEQLGEKLLTKDGLQDTDYKLAGKKVVGFYFSASWCPPCRQFTPFLSAVYDDMVEEHPEFELIFVSSDRDPSQYEKYYEDMPFLALPFDARASNDALSTKFGVTGIPMLVFVNQEGNVVTMDGRTVVAESRGDVEKLWEQLTKVWEDAVECCTGLKELVPESSMTTCSLEA
ncbi:hypothetical protein BBO99_00007981 [Phytophthora kernoviae]|uniref:protein-disulfide reductase n=2 Tax=Phytophthora kernoviae TaxID=325452 RepID=A0A3F2RL42_9STRA|nr:hypothetical protein G195_006066 [Phytophthora kernoviae 00238/432]KAG2526509.1 hypothetical protein JM18_004361 [Phytophthora kernoviae]KAG2530544.1 hypothetical protein JM16_000854 [Phytophthora kernoviae]RLN14739.1 hypothetical protein BBI17_007932 [Phytophthora kernoviae]RLN59593.1 hypothetical protein BBP00_00006427 [Phytophthora kernoviae]